MWSFPLPETAIPLEEPANPRGSRSYRRIADSGWEKCRILWKKTQIIFEFDSFFGVETGTFFAEKSTQILRTFPQKKVATFDPKKRVEFDEKSGYFSENVVFSSSGHCNSPFGAATLGILVSLCRRIDSLDFDKCHIFSQKSQFLVKFDSFFGVERGNFSLFLGTPAGTWDDLPNGLWWSEEYSSSQRKKSFEAAIIPRVWPHV